MIFSCYCNDYDDDAMVMMFLYDVMCHDIFHDILLYFLSTVYRCMTMMIICCCCCTMLGCI